MKMIKSILFLMPFVLSACVQTPQLSRDEQLQQLEKNRQFIEKYLTRTYAGKTKMQVIEAAEKVFELLDGDDVTYEHNENGFVANRKWQWYAVLAGDNGIDKWNVNVQDNGAAGMKVKVTENTISRYVRQNTTYVYGVGVMQIGDPTTTTVERYNDGKALYNLFFRRMDYMLGLSKEWPTCVDFTAEMKANPELNGDISAMCGPLAKDELPMELRPKK